MKYFIFVLLFVPVLAFAADGQSGLGGALQSIRDFGNDIQFFLSESVPNFFHRLAAYVFEAVIYVKYVLFLESVKFSWNVAKVILSDLAVSEHIMNAMSALPPSIRAGIVDLRIVDAINIILNAYASRFVLRMF
ncbi:MULTISPECIES: DUF2523 family protein [Shewanella]|nr:MULTISPECIES: DUF2523 family protein [Shewanella]MCE9783717.1 DUF2523 domain-containing protein [Shewanella algae]MDC8852768.1 DUF2523 family protein [Shewanella algae]